MNGRGQVGETTGFDLDSQYTAITEHSRCGFSTIQETRIIAIQDLVDQSAGLKGNAARQHWYCTNGNALADTAKVDRVLEHGYARYSGPQGTASARKLAPSAHASGLTPLDTVAGCHLRKKITRLLD